MMPTLTSNQAAQMCSGNTAQFCHFALFTSFKQRINPTDQQHSFQPQLGIRHLFAITSFQRFKCARAHSVFVVRFCCAVIKMMGIAANSIVAFVANVTAFARFIPIMKTKSNPMSWCRFWPICAKANNRVSIVRWLSVPQPTIFNVFSAFNVVPKPRNGFFFPVWGWRHNRRNLTNVRLIVNKL